jgi:bifunctional DNA-binding transcriptional regulator/antitoxin component of YhaV-PrlF toxin-antitoxin module
MRTSDRIALSRYAHVDENGHLILPPELADAWGLSPGDRVRIDVDGHSLQLQPPLNTCGGSI